MVESSQNPQGAANTRSPPASNGAAKGSAQAPAHQPVEGRRLMLSEITPPPPVQVQNVKAKQDHQKRILILGRGGCGKKALINTAARVNIPGQIFKLVDAPELDSQIMSNLEAFKKLANWLIDGTRIEAGVTGIVYIHCAGDPIESRTLAQHIRVISRVFLGEVGLPRLTILVVPSELGAPNPASAIGQILSRANAFRAACASGAEIVVASAVLEGIGRVLTSYASKDPVLLRIQHEHLRDPRIDVAAQIEESLGYCEKDSVKLRLNELAKRYQHHYQIEINKLQSSLRESEANASRCHIEKNMLQSRHQSDINKLQSSLQESQSNASQFSDDYAKVEQEATKLRADAASLRQQLYNTKDEYASLRSQLQLQENIDQGEIVQSLKDLNREIDEIGCSISSYLVDNHVRTVFNKDPRDITALHARHLLELKSLFGDHDKGATLIASSSGTGMSLEDFFDYAVRYVLCLSLHRRIFMPFHPGVDKPQNDIVSAMYEEVQRQEPQAAAAKWRASSFKGIYKPQPDAIAQRVNEITQKFVLGNLGRLMSYFFGQEANVVLEGQYVNRLERLVQMAWDWNSTLKGEVIMLGDFHPTIFTPSSRFDPISMSEFEPNPKSPQPKSILATLALGLISSRAIGGGRPPEKMVVCQAVVATSSLYE